MPITRRDKYKLRLKKSLPKHWQRTKRTEAEKFPEMAIEDRKRLALAREKDRTADWDYFGMSTLDVEKFLDAKLTDIIMERLRNRKSEKTVSVLDLGCGNGRALFELKRSFGEGIRTVGMVIEKSPNADYAGVDRLMKGPITEIIPRESFDVIYSALGSVFHSRLPRTALENVVKWLKPGGTAILHLFRSTADDRIKLNEVVTVLRQNGIVKPELEEIEVMWPDRKTFDRIWILKFKKPKIHLPD